MSLYFGTTEITGINNLVPQSGFDITDIWFGSTNVYTVWEIYEGTLPATINANGADMRQYQIYGADGGVGDKTANLFDKNTVVVAKYISANGVEAISLAPPTSGIRLHHSDYIPIIEEAKYTLFSEHGVMTMTGQTVAFCWYDLNKNFLGRSTQYIEQSLEDGSYSFTAESPLNAAFAIVNFFTKKYISVTVVEGTTALATYIPYGYEVNISTSIAPPIYIGDTALQKDEYIDYKEQKVYRMSGGVLTPTDPPVALPALPTCEGTTIVDYAGQSVAVPEKVVFEYRKEGF